MFTFVGNVKAYTAVDPLGPELVTTLDFSSGTGWVTLGTTTISDGVANIVATGSLNFTGSNWAPNQTNVFSATIPKNYRITFSVRQTLGTGNFQIANNFGIRFDQSVTGVMTEYTFDYNKISGTTSLTLALGGVTLGDEFELDSISVKEIL